MKSYFEIYEGPSWQDTQRDLELLEYTILRKMKKKVWKMDMKGSYSKVEYVRAKRLVQEFEASIKRRKAAWKNYAEKHGEKALTTLVLPKLKRFTDYLEARCS